MRKSGVKPFGAHTQPQLRQVCHSSTADLIHFNLPAQPLPAALQSFVSVTELSVLVQNSLIEQRTSSPVQGDYSSREALQRMPVRAFDTMNPDTHFTAAKK